MKRTLTLKETKKGEPVPRISVFYRNKDLGVFSCFLVEEFNMKAGHKYRVIIVKGSKYRISAKSPISACHIHTVKIVEDGDNEYTYLGLICANRFQKIFFNPKPEVVEDLYDITVMEVK